MPKRTDIDTILIIGAGPIVIGQACEFDYSGTQAVTVLKELGYKTVLVNSNPATIMTDPMMADKVYIEPVNAEFVEKIIQKENIDAILPTMGGQTALNVAMELHKKGVLEKYNIEIIGAKPEAIEKAENRQSFRLAMQQIGLNLPKAIVVKKYPENKQKLEEQIENSIEYIGFPCIFRPSYTLGGYGGGFANNRQEFYTKINQAIEASPIGEVLVEESVSGWKEYEMEVVRDKNDNAIIVCAIENIDPMGVHTGDSITICPPMTLTDKEYQEMRNQAIAVVRKIGVETGGANVQFAVNPENGDMVVIEMNPRVSRSSALASKATGFPIARIASYLAVGFTLDELRNEITGGVIPASFEPSIDYVVVKIPRFNFEKFNNIPRTLTTTMKSIGEVMAIGRSFHEAVQKALRALEIGLEGFDEQTHISPYADLKKLLAKPTYDRILIIAEAIRRGENIDDIYNITKIDKWFIERIAEIIQIEQKIRKYKVPKNQDDFRWIKMMGFSDARIAQLTENDAVTIRQIRKKMNVKPVYHRVDSCAGEFFAKTACLYSTYEQPYQSIKTQKIQKEFCEANPNNKNKIVILGAGPNRIGQGIEFDYCCCHAAFALKEKGYETIMINCNPETVSTDYKTANRLYFEAINDEEVINIIETENKNGSVLGVIVQFGGQTPLKLAKKLENSKIPILGTSPKSIEIAEDRQYFKKLLEENNIKQTQSAIATNLLEAVKLCDQIGYPIVIRPSFVLGGRAMEIVRSQQQLEKYIQYAIEAADNSTVLLDKYLENATELDVDAIYDGDQIYICGIMQHIEEAGIHSGDSACVIPPISIEPEIIDEICRQTEKLAKILKVKGIMNVQFAVKQNELYVLEVNPRASRTIPFVAKATGVPVARHAALVMAGEKLCNLQLPKNNNSFICVKEAVFPFSTFPDVDTALGPEMRSTGEVMAIDENFPRAFAKSQIAIGTSLPQKGNVFISVHDNAKNFIIKTVKTLVELGFEITATNGTADVLQKNGIKCDRINKVYQGNPNCVSKIYQKKFCLVLNTPGDANQRYQSQSIRKAAQITSTPCVTTVNGAIALVSAIKEAHKHTFDVKPLQNYFQ